MENENKNLTPICIIYIDGNRMNNSYDGALISVRTHNCLDGIPCTVITFDYTNKELKYETYFSMESEVTITLGYKDDMQEVFSGEITKRGIHLLEYGEQTFVVKVSSYMQRLKHGKHCTAWENKTASQTVKELLEKYGLSAECDDFGVAQPYAEQINMTDYDFLFQQTVTYGRFVYAEGKTIYVSSQMTNHKDDIVLEWGKSLVSASAAEDITEVIASVSCVGWSMMKCSSFTSTVRLSDVPVKIGGEKSWADGSPSAALYNETETFASFTDQADAEAVAKGRLQYNSYRFASAKGKTEGNAEVFPGMRVTMKYIGTQYSGEYLVGEVEHEFSYKNGFKTRFSLVRNMLLGETKGDTVEEVDRKNSSTDSSGSMRASIRGSTGMETKEEGADFQVGEYVPDDAAFAGSMNERLFSMQSPKQQFADLVQKTYAKHLMKKKYIDKKYMCTHFVRDILEDKADEYMPSLNVVQSMKAQGMMLTKDADEGVYIFYKQYKDKITGHTGFIWIDKKGNQHVLHNGKALGEEKYVNTFIREKATQGNFNYYFLTDKTYDVQYKLIPSTKVVKFKDVQEMDKYSDEWDNE